MGRCPFGGQTWLYLNWLRGLARLGHDVYYVEDDATWPYDPRVDRITDDPTLRGVLPRSGCWPRSASGTAGPTAPCIGARTRASA